MLESLAQINWTDFALNNIPAILIGVAGLVLLPFSAFSKEMGKRIIWIVSLVAVIAAFFATWWGWLANNPSTILMWTNDRLSASIDMIFFICAGLTLLASKDALKRDGIEVGEYYSLILFAVLGMMMISHAADLVILFIGVEVVSISAYVLSGLKRNFVKSNEAALKYLILGAFASAFLIYGIAFTYGVIGSTQLVAVGAIKSFPAGAQGWFVLLAAALLLVGLGFKIAAVPFHFWTPDVYEGSPTIVTAFMASAIKAAGFAGLIRVILAFANYPAIPWVKIFTVLAVATMTIGNLIALKQSNIKRMLAYSSIAHAGYALVGIAAAVQGGEISPQALGSVIFYLLTYGIMTLGAFGAVIALGRKGDEPDEIGDWAGLAKSHPWLAAAMAVFMISLTGIPPTMGFMGKFYLFNSAMEKGMVGLVIVGVLNSVVSAYYYLGVVMNMYFRKEEGIVIPPMPYSLVTTLFLCFLGLVYWGIFPADVFQIAKESVAQIIF